MTILIRPPRSVKKAYSKEVQETLDRLDTFLDENNEDLAEFLYGFWGDQQNAVTYHELRDAVSEGALSQELIRAWQQDYTKLVPGKLVQVWQTAMQAGAAGQPLVSATSFSINMQTPGIMNWINSRGAEFVTSSMQTQKDAIRALLANKMIEQHTTDELARLIRPCIGLTEAQTKATMRLYDTVKATLKKEHPNMREKTAQKKALDAAQKYAEKKHRQRAFTIAQTELAYSYNQGADQGIRQAQDAGLIGTVRKRWSTSGDENVCDICAALDGVEIDLDDSFDFKGRVLFTGQKMLPPAHPRCACAVMYIEVHD
ncbi:MAG: phage head morphogenesis protein [Lachnospiraceae bacterium]|nr:phage head morphogenesis protein [Lachnospiraceae bacterium]